MNRDNQFAFYNELLSNIFNSVSAHIAVLDEKGVIIETNQAWKSFSMENGLPENFNFNQLNYLGVCEAASDEGIKDARTVASGIRQVINGEIDEFLYDYPCHSPERPRGFCMRAVLMADEGPVRVIISHEDITQLKLAQEALKENQKQLEDKNQSLNELNTGLKVLIRQREEDKAEIQVASLVKDGKTTSEIADILFVSEATISFHRKNLRVKLGLKNKQKNLRSFLLSMS